MENGGYLLAAYAVVWAGVFGLILALLNRQKKLRQEIKSLNETYKGKERG